ncbi:response regulator [Moraxellaceae bacterium AER2_44_116]|jgi:twitching motility two-component system response regulator PilH|nr:response regulator [Moraxellaceae bacterium]TQC99326.1 response regulator [Moraxellaceae bacterium AER2_44_116]
MANILIIDDSPTYQTMVGGILQKRGYVCSFEDRGESGIATAIKTHPDLILMDVIMPGISGFQATRQLSKNPETLNIPIIIISTKDQTSDRLWGLRQGAREYLTKDVDEAVLIATIENVLQNKQTG